MLNLQPYENPQYFVYLIIALLPVIIGMFKEKRYWGMWFSTYYWFTRSSNIERAKAQKTPRQSFILVSR